jgi:hypothetical protein
MLNPFKEVNWQPDTPARKAFGKSLMIGFPIIGAVLFLLKWALQKMVIWPLWLAIGGAGVGSLCWLVPAIALPFYLLWYGVGCSIGLVVTNVIISAIYYLVFTPVGFALRTFGKDPMERAFQPEAKSYWKDAEKITNPDRYFRQF